MLPSSTNWEAIMTAVTCLCASTKNGGDNNFYANLTNDLNYAYPDQTRVFITPEELQQMQTKILELENFAKQLQSQQTLLYQEIKRMKIPTFCPTPPRPAEPNQFTILDIKIPKLNEPIQAVCNGEWLVILMRIDGSLNFYGSWDDYKKGFGIPDGEFFIGLEKLYTLTGNKPFELMIRLTDFDNTERIAKYDGFQIGSEQEGYALKSIGKFIGNAGDSLRRHVGSKFSTYDRDNDKNHFASCAELSSGAWWYADEPCHDSNLFGHYSAIPEQPGGRGINWKTFRGMDYSLKEVILLIKPTKKC